MKIKAIILVTVLVTVLVFAFLGVATAVLASEEGIQNPLGNVNDPREIVGNVIKAILGIVGSLALAIFIFGGFTWITSAGNDEKIKKGKDMITWATFGLVVIFLSYALVTFVITAVTGGSSNSGGTTQQNPGSQQSSSL